MESIKIWTAMDWTHLVARLNPGEIKAYTDHPKEGSLMYQGDLKDLLKEHFRIYLAYTPDDRMTPWFFSEEEALAEAKAQGFPENDCGIDTAEIAAPYLKPAKFPIKATLDMGSKGLYCRLNLHPELDGACSRGKLFFPNRSCVKDLCAGPVIITEVRDKGSYGFFFGHMEQFQAPSEEQVADLIQKEDLWNSTLQFRTGKFGTYVQVVDPYYNSSKALVLEEGEVTLNYMLPNLDEHSTITEEIPAREFMAQGYLGYGIEEWKSKFLRFEFAPNAVMNSPKFISKLVDEAAQCSFIRLRRFMNLDYFTIDFPDEAILNFSAAEMEELAKVVKKVNQSANEAMRAKAKKGELKLK